MVLIISQMRQKFSENKKIIATVNGAFTLVELTVSISLFLIVTLAIFQIFISVVRVERRFLAKTDATAQSAYFMEYISRTVRMAKKDKSGVCITQFNNFEKTGRGGLRFLSYNDKCLEFYVSGQSLLIEIDGEILQLTSPDIKVTAWNVYDVPAINGWLQTDWRQPRVTFSLNVLDKSGSELTLQTTISQRNIDALATPPTP